LRDPEALYFTSVLPVGDVHVALGQKCLDRAAQQRGMSREGRHAEQPRVASCDRAPEVQQAAKWRLPYHLFVHCSHLPGDRGARDVEALPAVAAR
jgi:hypothetical protein